LSLSLWDRWLVGIEWDRRCVRFVQARIGRQGARGLRASAVPVPADVAIDDADALGDFLRRALEQEKIAARRAVVAVPRDQAVLNMLSLPQADSDELAGIVQFQVAKELPFPATEAVIDFAVAGPSQQPTKQPSGGGEGPTCDVLVAAVRNEVFEFYRQVCQRAQLHLERVGLRPNANLVAIRRALGEECERGLLLFVDVGPAVTEIDVIRMGRLVFSRAASVTVSVPADRAGNEEASRQIQAAVSDLLVEVTRSIAAYRVTDPGARFDRILVGGSCGIEAELAEAAGRQLGAPAELYQPPDEVQIGQGGPALATAFGATIGLILSHGEDPLQHFDLLHPKQPGAAKKERMRRVPLAAAVALLFLATAAVGYMRYVQPKKAELQKLTKQVTASKKRAKKLEQFQAELERASRWAEAEVIWLDELRRLAEVFPSHKDAYIAKLDLDAERGISLDLRARSEDLPSAIREKLNKVRVGDAQSAHFLAETGAVQQSRDERYGFSAKMKIFWAERLAEQARGKGGASGRSRTTGR